MPAVKMIYVPNPVLSQVSEPVRVFGSDLKKLVRDLRTALASARDPKGVGIAAVQIGVLKRVFLMKPNERRAAVVIINPEIISTVTTDPNAKGDEEPPLEGCLSVPGIWAPIRREFQITIKYQNEVGEPQTATYQNFESAVVQHELDHLNGILFTQRAAEQGMPIYKEKKGKLVEI